MTGGTARIVLRGAQWPYRLAVDTLLVAGLCAVVAVLLSATVVRDALALAAAQDVLTLVAAAVGAASAILAVVASRMLGEPRLAWVAAALVLYCAVVLPWTTAAPTEFDLSQSASRLVAYLTALLLLVLSLRPPRAVGAAGAWVVMLVGGVLAVVVLALPDPTAMAWLVEGPVLTVAVLVGWTGAAIGFVVDGLRTQSTPRLRLGLGLVVLATAQLYRVATAEATVDTNLTFTALRLVGLAIVLVALVQKVWRALSQLRYDQWRQQEELTVAALHMERASEIAAERNHELRNGLAGLAGITHLLGSNGGEEHERLKHAVLAELGRLHRLLDGGDPETGQEVYLVEPVLTGLVALRGHRRITLHVEPELTTRGDSAVLAQVVTNLLANCDRHAPGAPITISAERRGDDVVIEVRDEGPGIPAGLEDAVLERGVRNAAAGGSGLGLHISEQLLARDGGTLALRSAQEPRGCIATVTIPAADPLVSEPPQIVTPPRGA